MIVRSWKSAVFTAALPFKGLRYDAGSWIAEILDNSWTSYDVVKRRKLSETAWEEWLIPHAVPRLPRESFGVEEFNYTVVNGLLMMKGWSWQEQVQAQVPQPVQVQQPPQQPPLHQLLPQPPQRQHQQLQHPSQKHPQQQKSQPPLQTSQQRPIRDRGASSQQPAHTTYNQANLSWQPPLDSVDHSQPQPVGQPTRELHSSQHTSRPPPPPVQQPVIPGQPWTPLVQSVVPELQYRTPVASFPRQKGSAPYLPQKKGRQRATSGRAHLESFPQDNVTREPVTCQILD